MKKAILIMILAFGLSSLIPAQNPEWIIFNTTNSGLSDNGVWSIAIEENGTKWIGTRYGGLTKFDGITWTTYNTSNSGLPDNWVISITIDKNGTKWIGTIYGGLVKFDGSTWTTFNTSNSGIPSNYVDPIAIDSNGLIWIGMHSVGIATFDETNWTLYNPSNSGMPNDFVHSLVIDDCGMKWIGTGYNYPGGNVVGGLTKFDGLNWTTYTTSNSGLPNYSVGSIAIDSSGTIWMGTGGGLAKFDGINWTSYTTLNSGIPHDQVISLAIDDNGSKWLGTYDDGIVKFDGINWTILNTLNSELPDGWILSISIEDNGSKWIGTSEGGLAVYSGNSNPSSSKEYGLSNQSITVSPNPVFDFLNFVLKNKMNISFIEIYDFWGSLVMNQSVFKNQNRIDVQGLPAGVYFLKIHSNKGIVTQKIIKL